jgi:hypothetical protein
MEKGPNQKRIIILSVMAVMAYVFIIANSFSAGFDAFKMGYWSAGGETVKNQDYSEPPSKVYFLSIRPKEGFKHFHEQVYNNRTGTFYPSRYNCMLVAMPKGTEIPSAAKHLSWLQSFLISITLILFIVLPVVFIRLIRSLYAGNIFDIQNTKYTRNLGIILLLIYGCAQGVNYTGYRIEQALFSFDDYRHVFSFSDNYLLMMGLAILLTAEILDRGLNLKEEHDLTI